MRTPQIIYLALTFIRLLLVAYKHGEPREDYDILASLISCIIVLGLLLWGGFFSH